MKTTTLSLKYSMNGSFCRLALLFIPLALVCFALSPVARAVCQEGCDITNFNTFLGDDALLNNTGPDNTAIGNIALTSNTTGNANTAVGSNALASNTTGFRNTANGFDALGTNTTGSDNTAIGFNALSDSNGTNNAATGTLALSFNTTGNANTADGVEALFVNMTGSLNTAIGFNALSSITSGSNNIALGSYAGLNRSTGSNNIDIGNEGKTHETGTIRVGTTGTHANAYIAGISGVTVPTGVPVIIEAHGHLGTTTSSARFKEAIKPMDKASEAILALKPVTFRYKHELDPNGIPQFGLVAEDVEKVNPDLVARDDQGKPYTVRYEAVNAMLLNEFLKEHRKVEQQRRDFEAALAQQQKQIEALAAGLQKVSAQLELNRRAPQTVVGNH
jgi:Chaperone of endosialidase